MRESRRIGHHFQFAHTAALHIHARYTRHARKHRSDLKARDVVERRGVATFEVVADDRKHRRRQPLNLQIDACRQVAAHGVHARLHLLQRHQHVD